MMRNWTEEERSIAIRESREEDAVWVKFLTERSWAVGRLDPHGTLRARVGKAVDDHWTGRMVDLVSFGEDFHDSWRISSSMLIEDCMGCRFDSGQDDAFASLGTTLSTVAPDDEGPDILVLLCAPSLRVPQRLTQGSRHAEFMIAAIGGVPSAELSALAKRSGGRAMAIRDEEDADFSGAEFCRRFRELARSRPADD